MVCTYYICSLSCLDIVDARSPSIAEMERAIIAGIVIWTQSLEKKFALFFPQTTSSQVVTARLSLNVFDPWFSFLLVDNITERRSLVITQIFQPFASTLFASLIVW